MYGDRRLTAVYDLINPHIEDTRFYLDLAARLGAGDVIDFGCGTGRLALELASAGHKVIGIDPSREMIDVARLKGGADHVRWVEGSIEQLSAEAADLVLMTGHVAQVFLGDQDWLDALVAIRRTLRPGGWLAFESLNPLCEPWQMWTRDRSFRSTQLPSGPLETWYEVESVKNQRVAYTVHYRFGVLDDIQDKNVVVFRTNKQIHDSLARCGYLLAETYGSWLRSPLTTDSIEMIYVARRPATATKAELV